MPSKNKNYYQKLIKEHKQVLSKARKLIEVMLNKLEAEIEEFEKALNTQDHYDETFTAKKFWWGDKESAASSLNRLTMLLLKIIPLEQDIARIDLTKADLSELEDVIENTKLPEEDLEIIERFLERSRGED